MNHSQHVYLTAAASWSIDSRSSSMENKATKQQKDRAKAVKEEPGILRLRESYIEVRTGINTS